MRSRFALIAPIMSLLVACSDAGDAAPEVSEDSFTAGAASKALSALLFDDADPKGEGIDYVLLGHLPGSKEACSVRIRRRGLDPAPNEFSSVAIHPFGKSARTVEAHGPVDIGFALPPGFSSARESIKTTGGTTVFTQKGEGQESSSITLSFTSGPPRFDKITSAAIAGNTLVGPQAAACSDLRPLIILRDSELTPITNKARDGFAKANKEDLSSLEYEGCDVVSPRRVVCAYGDSSNEETLELTYSIAAGKLGQLVKQDRSSATF